jgi:hypothetical protein
MERASRPTEPSSASVRRPWSAPTLTFVGTLSDLVKGSQKSGTKSDGDGIYMHRSGVG